MQATQAGSGGGAEAGVRRRPDAAEANNIYVADPNQLELAKAISSMELLNIAEKFDQYPGEELDCEQFVNIMREVIGTCYCTAAKPCSNPRKLSCQQSERDDFIQQLVDLFYRSNKVNAATIKFADLTSYLIEHEIKNYTEDATHIDM